MTQHKILLLGSGYVAKPCADVILRRSENLLTVASRSIKHAQALANQLGKNVTATAVDVSNESELEQLISQHDLVISLIPYTHHATVIKAAIKHKKHVVTTSYINPQMAALDEEAKAAGITVMNEIGVDPGIDHLYAVQTIDQVHKDGGKIIEFVSYCGGLPAPECSNNPLGYKFSWSSRGVLLALRNNARYVKDGKVVDVMGVDLMKSATPIWTGYPAFAFVGYANRDSAPYNERYHIPEAKTVLRGTLRYDGFQRFIQVLVVMGFLDDTEKPYLKTQDKLTWRQVTAQVLGLDAKTSAQDLIKAIIQKAGVDKWNEEQRSHIVLGLKWLGVVSDQEYPDLKIPNLLDTLCATLEQKMSYEKDERDMVLLQHKFSVLTKEGKPQTRLCTMLEFGVPGGYTAMAKTVGVPCGLAVQLVLDGKLNKRGVIAPMDMSVCAPLIEALEKEGISMKEEIIE